MNSTLTDKTEEVKPGRLFAGIDLGLDQNVVVVLSEQGQRLDRYRFPTSRDGYDDLLRRLESWKVKRQAAEVWIGMEPTNYFWKLLATYLEAHGWPYRLVNPYTVKKHREGDQLDRAKDDRRDALTIADLVRTGKFTQTRLLHGAYAELRQLAKAYQQRKADWVRQQTRLWSLVGQAFPELLCEFRDLSGVTVRALLRRHACAAHVRTLSEEAFLKAVRQDLVGHKLGVARLRQVYQWAQTSLGLQASCSALQQAIGMHLETLELLSGQVDQACTALLIAFRAMPEASGMLSLPDLGELSAALILSELGDPHRYRRGRQWIKLAGTQPTPNTSGRKSTSRTPMSHKGRSQLRRVLYFATLRLIQVNPAFRKRYQQLLERRPSPLTKMQAVGVLMNKLLRILWALTHRDTRYDPSLF